MSQEKCVSYCSQKGYSYAGVEYGQECWCGSEISSPSAPTNEADCSFSCPGASGEMCGAGDRMNVFTNGAGQPVQNSGNADWQSLGCYTDSVSSRTLEQGASISGDSMTVSHCLDVCAQGGFSYAGLEYARECFCGNSIRNPGMPTSASSCNMVCTGNSTEICGGSNALNLYAARTAPAPTSRSSATPPSSTSIAIADCPASNGTLYASNGLLFQIECGVDHQGGDMQSTSTNNLQGCVDACAQVEGCVDVSFLGVGCYLKSTLGEAVYSNQQVNGAKLLGPASVAATSSSTSAASSSALSATSSVASMNTATSDSVSVSSSTTSSDASSSSVASSSPTASVASSAAFSSSSTSSPTIISGSSSSTALVATSSSSSSPPTTTSSSSSSSSSATMTTSSASTSTNTPTSSSSTMTSTASITTLSSTSASTSTSTSSTTASASSTPSNLILNPSFENGISYWNFNTYGATAGYNVKGVTNANGLDGFSALETQPNSNKSSAIDIYQLTTKPLIAGYTYKLTFYQGKYATNLEGDGALLRAYLGNDLAMGATGACASLQACNIKGTGGTVYQKFTTQFRWLAQKGIYDVSSGKPANLYISVSWPAQNPRKSVPLLFDNISLVQIS